MQSRKEKERLFVFFSFLSFLVFVLSPGQIKESQMTKIGRVIAEPFVEASHFGDSGYAGTNGLRQVAVGKYGYKEFMDGDGKKASSHPVVISKRIMTTDSR